MKKANVVPIHTKDDKQTIENYRPVSLPPICRKIFERLLYDTMFNLFPKNNNLLPSNKSGFRPGDSYINQFLSINHEILSAFDMGLEIRGIFLDISKAFNKVWHDGLIFKLPQNRIYGEMINILEDFLSDRKQSSKNHLQSAFSNVKKTTGLLRKLQPNIPIIIYKSINQAYSLQLY